MGVKDFWNVSAPCEERISLHQLRGQTLAIDLAGWIVQNQTVPGMQHRVTRPHLRNLVFRTNSLLSLDILPVFVLDGVAPKIKAQTVEARNQLVWGSRSSQAAGSRSSQAAGSGHISSSPKVQKRRQFTGVLKECGKLLESLGLPYVVAPGEAEAYCAALDRAGVVDGVISDDSDSMCYGARTVYRNFSADPKNFSVSKYHNKRLRKEVGLSRERIVLMSLLLGCDYAPGGVNGVGKDNLVRLFNLWGPPAKGELDKVLNWSESDELAEIAKTPHCGTCGHPGTVGSHRKNGCSECNTTFNCEPGAGCDCAYHSKENQLAILQNSIRRKALESPGWPHLEVVDEFYSLDNTQTPHDFAWTCPRPQAFLQICMSRMDWEQEYTLEKIQNLVARWQVKNPEKSSGVTAVSIIKSRIQGGQNMMEVEFRSTIDSLPETFTTCVPTADFEVCYADLLNQWIQEKEAKKKKPKKKKENKEPTERVVKKSSAKPDLEKQPSIKQFFNIKKSAANPSLPLTPVNNDDRSVKSASDDKPVNLNPKKLVMTKKTFKDKVVITSAKNVTVEEKPQLLSDNFKYEGSFIDSFDNLSLGESATPKAVTQKKLNIAAGTPNVQDTELKELNETYSNEISGIMNQILGISDSVEKTSKDLNRLSIASGMFPKLDNKTSTPDLRIHDVNSAILSDDMGSPLLGRNSKNSGDKPVQNERKNAKLVSGKSTNIPPVNPLKVCEAESEDEFDNMLNHCTPLMDRVKKRLGN